MNTGKSLKVDVSWARWLLKRGSVVHRSVACSAEKATWNSFEPESDDFLQSVMDVGHVTLGIQG